MKIVSLLLRRCRFISRRSKFLCFNFFYSVISRSLITLLQLFVVGLIGRFLSRESFGKWMLISQSLVLLTIIDLGVGGGGLRNELTKLRACNSHAQREVFLCSFFVVLILSILTSFMCYLSLKNLENYVFLTLLFIILRIPFSLYMTGFLAYQQFGKKSFCEFQEILVFCLSVYGFVTFNFSEKNLFILSYCCFFIATIFSFLYFLRSQKWKISLIEFSKFKSLFTPLVKVNFYFWLLNVFSLGLFGLCPFIINRLIGLEKTGEFCLFQRIVLLILGVHFLLVNSLWSGFSDALHRKDFEWIKTYLKKGIQITIIYFIGFGVIFIFFHRLIIFIWTGKIIENYRLAVMFSVSALIYGIVNMLSAILNSQNKLSRQIVYSFLGFFVHVFLGLVLGKIFSEFGVLLAFVVALIPLLISNIKEVKSLSIWSYASR